MKRYHTLHKALQRLDPDRMVIAEDIAKNGQKGFYCESLDTLTGYYEKLSQKHWYECLVENRPTRIFLDVEAEFVEPSINMDAIMAFLTACIHEMFSVEAAIHILNSSSDQKQSWHVIVTNVYLENVYHVGAFIRRCVLFMQFSFQAGEAPFNPSDLDAIDTAVYTKNRMFRVPYSSKFGSERILKCNQPWHTLLVQASTTGTVYSCSEIDESVPVSTSAAPFSLFENIDGQWVRRRHRTRTSTSATDNPLLVPVLNYLDQHLDAKCQRHKQRCTATGHYSVASRSKCCGIAQREHRGNNIWFAIDLNRQEVRQRCYDEECQHKSVVVDMPKGQWSLWNEAWAEVIHAPMNKKTLFNMTY